MKILRAILGAPATILRRLLFALLLIVAFRRKPKCLHIRARIYRQGRIRVVECSRCRKVLDARIGE